MKHIATSLIVAICCVVLACSTRAQERSAPVVELIPWHPNLAPALEEARRRNVPVLVRVGADWCPWCRKLDEEIEKQAVQDQLVHWSLAHLDADDVPDEVRQLRVGPIPALRVLDTTGHVVASHDGFLPADRLIQWLQRARDQNPADSADAIADLAAAEPAKLVRLLGHRNPATREAAIRKSIPERQRLALDVVGTMHRGNLASRISALELLGEWKAPVAAIDPWKPETITTPRLTELEEWAERQQSAPAEPVEPEPLTDAKRSELRAEIDRVLVADQAAADAIGSRLARFGSALLADVEGRRDAATTDAARHRLDWLRLRLLSSDQLSIRWPGGLARLASPDAAVRREAAGELPAHVTAADAPLLNELIRHPDASVRELCLRSLSHIGQENARQFVTLLLEDPDLNVRSAALRHIADSPTTDYAPALATFVTRENDVGLIVNAVRIMAEFDAVEVKGTLVDLLEHASWQVRAEALEVLASLCEGDPGTFGAVGTDEDRARYEAKVAQALADEDAFVISRALAIVRQQPSRKDLPRLIQAAEKHPELVEAIIDIIFNLPDADAEVIKVYQGWLHHKDPVIRAAALRGLNSFSDDGNGFALLAALSDESAETRIAATEILLDRCEWERIRMNYVSWAFRLRPYLKGIKFTDDPQAEVNVTRSLFLFDSSLRAPLATLSEDDVAPDTAWVTDFRKGKNRPEWLTEAIEPLTKMLRSNNADEQVAAAVALLPLGRDEIALPVLRERLEDPAYFDRAARGFSWLPWESRKTWFKQLADKAQSAEQLTSIIDELMLSCDLRLTELLWELLERPNLADVARHVVDRLALLHGALEATADGKATSPIAMSGDELSALARNGKEGQRLAAALLLVRFDRASAQVILESLANSDTSAERRSSALHALLLCADSDKAVDIAIGGVESSDDGSRRLSLAYLARDPRTFANRVATGQWIPQSLVEQFAGTSSSVGRPSVLDPTNLPDALSREKLETLLVSPDADTAAYAGYLLARLGNAQGPAPLTAPLTAPLIAPLIARWRANPKDRADWNDLVITAITATNAEEHVGVLDEIYVASRKSPQAVRDLYWEIRSMPAASPLRKRIRDEVGMEALK